MKREQVDDILKKYKAGLSSLNEEHLLLSKTDEMEDSDKIWFSYLKKNQVKVPTSIENDIWQTLVRRKQKIRMRRITAVAAAVLLFLSLFLFKTHQNQQEQIRKKALLQEAISMVSDKEENLTKTVLYQDQYVIIYSK